MFTSALAGQSRHPALALVTLRFDLWMRRAMPVSGILANGNHGGHSGQDFGERGLRVDVDPLCSDDKRKRMVEGSSPRSETVTRGVLRP